MSAPVKLTYSVVVLAGIAVAGLWWLGRRSLMQKRHMEILSVLAQTNEQPPATLDAAPTPASPEAAAAPAALPPA